MTNKNTVIERYIALVEKIANGKNNTLSFTGKDMTFYRGEIHIIKKIGDHPGIFSSEIAREMGITRAVIHKTLLKLEERGFVEKEADTGDKKRKKLFLTKRGQAAYTAHEQYHQRCDKSFFDFIDSLNEQECALIECFLEKANEMVEKHF
ncbi:MarR family transcriptional regulator [Treponema vincentii]|uniref:MarR family winged helix-turn-helix transcriptional regulator n=1 Tax=Treponema vincentii TaxID=69710 RepID=UPI0020A52BFA|nr:MarR family transcriptional regulator [Treponema vincentii]UTC46898.1 MarR family transcriptional regulator [Treponema vincentii]